MKQTRKPFHNREVNFLTKSKSDTQVFLIVALSLALLRACINNFQIAYEFFKAGVKDTRKLSPEQMKAIFSDFQKALNDIK